MKLLFRYWDEKKKIMSKPFKPTDDLMQEVQKTKNLTICINKYDRAGKLTFVGDIIHGSANNKNNIKTEFLGEIIYHSITGGFMVEIPAEYFGQELCLAMTYVGATPTDFLIVANKFENPGLQHSQLNG